MTPVTISALLLLNLSSVLNGTLDPFGNEKVTPAPETLLDTVPPVIYKQTLGPLYIMHSSEYTEVWCNASKGDYIHWTYNRAVPPRDRFRWINSAGSSRLIVSDPRVSVHGYIQCLVSNSLGDTFGDPVHITHSVLRRHGDLHSRVYAYEGDHVTLSCDAHFDDIPPSNITWHRNHDRDITMTAHDGFFCNTERDICVFTSVSLNDTSVYICSFYKYNRAEEKSFHLSVRQRPHTELSYIEPLNLISQVSSPSIVRGSAGDNVDLQCVFRGSPESIRWYYQASSGCPTEDTYEPLARTMRYNETLTIHDMSYSDQGYYLCVASTRHGSYTHRIHLEYVRAPVLDHPVSHHTILEGETLSLTCLTPTAAPAVTIQWWVNRRPVEELHSYQVRNDGHELVLQRATLHDTGTVLCNVSNIAGHVLGYRTVRVNPARGHRVAPSAVPTGDGTTPGAQGPQETELNRRQTNPKSPGLHQVNPSPDVDSVTVTAPCTRSTHSSLAEIVDRINGNCTIDRVDALQLVSFLYEQRLFMDELKSWCQEYGTYKTQWEAYKRLLGHGKTPSGDPKAIASTQTARVFVPSTVMPNILETGTVPEMTTESSLPGVDVPLLIINGRSAPSSQYPPQNMVYNCSYPHGCHVSGTTPLSLENTDRKSKMQRNKLLHDHYEYPFELEMKVSYTSESTLRRIRLQLTTSRRLEGLSCRPKDTTAIEINVSGRLCRRHPGGSLSWEVAYHNPFLDRVANCTGPHKTKVKAKVEDLETSGWLRCWSDRHGSRLYSPHGGMYAETKCRLTRV